MSTGGIVMMVAILAWVWGGFAVLMWQAMKLDRERRR
jgi:hypothetical protein